MNARAVDRALIGAFAAVVLSFVAASWLSQIGAGEIEEAALSIHTNAAPSIRRLANTRAELRRLQLMVHRALDEAGPSRQRVLEIDAGRELVDQEVREYRQLPVYPGEAQAWRQAEDALDALDRELSGIVASLENDDLEGARGRQERLDEETETVARALSRAIDVNVAAASRLAADIGRSRRRGIHWTVTLDAAGVLLAGIAAALSLRISRAHSRAVQAYRDIAERRADELEQFAARMAHDVRTPLAAISLSLEVAGRYGSSDPRFSRALTRSQKAFSQTMSIIDALFEFASSGARPQPGARASMADAAEDVAAVMRARAEEIGAEIVVRASSHAEAPCAAGVLGSAIGNLVGNALTYVDGAATRRVTIEVTDDADEVKTTVSDTGPGLPVGTNPDHLFEPYVRGERARGRGLGLGLATVKRMVEAHGGRVGVRSSSHGCAFWFTLPRLGIG